MSGDRSGGCVDFVGAMRYDMIRSYGNVTQKDFSFFLFFLHVSCSCEVTS